MSDAALRELARRWRSTDAWTDWCAWAAAAARAGEPAPARAVMLVGRIAVRQARVRRASRHDESLVASGHLTPAIDELEQQWGHLVAKLHGRLAQDVTRLERILARLVARGTFPSTPPGTWPLTVVKAANAVRDEDRRRQRNRRCRGRGRADLRQAGTMDRAGQVLVTSGPHRWGEQGAPRFLVRADGAAVSDGRILARLREEAWRSSFHRRTCALCRLRRLVNQDSLCADCHGRLRAEVETLTAVGELGEDEDLDELLAAMEEAAPASPAPPMPWA